MRILFAMSILWLTIAVEIACSQVFPHGALLLPVACGTMFWMSSGTGILLSASALLIDWIARPGLLPLCPMLLPSVAVFLIRPVSRTDEYRSRRKSLFHLMTPLHLPLMTMLAIGLQLMGQVNPASATAFDNVSAELRTSLPSLLIIGLPISAGIAMLMRLADELGLRRANQNWI